MKETVKQVLHREIRMEDIKKAISYRNLLILFALTAVLIVSFLYTFKTAPKTFPVGTIITIAEGSTLEDVSLSFKERDLIRSATALRGVLLSRGKEDGVIAGDYIFDEPKNVFEIADIITDGAFGVPAIKLTIPEGLTNEEVAVIIDETFDHITAEEYIEATKDLEGYLFPDTYFFLPNVALRDVIGTMRENFDEKILSIQEDIDNFGAPLEEVISMAAILEEEARTTKSRRIIAGILWTRIEIGMPLQVDAVFPYINGKNTFELTLEDLKIDSPYNTYQNLGLPPGAIANPSLDAILAAVTPIPSDYLYYLSDLDGNMHYAETFELHKQNKFRYLD